MLNTKSQLEDFLPLLLLIFGLVFLFFFISCTIDIGKIKSKESIGLHSLSKDSTNLLLNFVRSHFPLENNENSNIAEAINVYFITEDEDESEDLLESLEEKANDFFSNSDLETDYTSFVLEIKYPGKKAVIFGPGEKNYVLTTYTKTLISEMRIPAHDPDKFIELRSFLVRTKW